MESKKEIYTRKINRARTHIRNTSGKMISEIKDFESGLNNNENKRDRSPIENAEP